LSIDEVLRTDDVVVDVGYMFAVILQLHWVDFDDDDDDDDDASASCAF
jgi:hypothetical protein